MKMFKILKIKTIVCIFIVVLITVGLSAVFLSARAKTPNAKEPADRVLFLKELGIEVVKTTEKKKDVQIPLYFSEVYNRYNELQKTAGYDLLDYRGEKAVLYSYPAQNLPGYTVNLLCYKDRVIGGDISTAELSGNMVALKTEEIKKCLK